MSDMPIRPPSRHPRSVTNSASVSSTARSKSIPPTSSPRPTASSISIPGTSTTSTSSSSQAHLSTSSAPPPPRTGRISFAPRNPSPSSAPNRSSSTSTFTSTSTSSPFSAYLGSTASFASKARNALATAGGYVASAASAASNAAVRIPQDKKSWDEWTGAWRGEVKKTKGQEVLYVLPGWAVKRPRLQAGMTDKVEMNEFDLQVLSHGFGAFVREPGSASRTQRAFMGIAKRFAALPPMTVMTETLTSSPKEEKTLDNLVPSSQASVSTTPPASSPASRRSSPNRRSSSRRNSISTASDLAFADPTVLQLAHEYLDTRLRPFWSSTLPYRRVILSLYSVPLTPTCKVDAEIEKVYQEEPLITTTFTTNPQGHFEHAFVVPWERLSSHKITSGLIKQSGDWGVVVRAQLVAEETTARLRKNNASDNFAAQASNNPPSAQGREQGPPKSELKSSKAPSSFPNSGESAQREIRNSLVSSSVASPSGSATGPLEVSNVESFSVVGVSQPGGVRIISDLDDTVKHSDIISGGREVFRNVFCRKLEDICVPGMSQLYTKLGQAGAKGFHFVSNSPFELFPVISDFLRLHSFPSNASLKLKFYGGRSIVTSLFEPAGERKRPSIIQILDAFPDSKFIMFGDSGEQDLELYIQIAKERPSQVAAIFIRDVTTGRVNPALRFRTPTMNAIGDSDPSMASTAEIAALSLEAANETASTTSSGASTPIVPLTSQSISRSTSTSVNTSPHAPSSTTSGGGRGGGGEGGSVNQIGVVSASTAFADTVAELEALTAAQQKVLRRAALWEGRVAKAKAECPTQVKLEFFQNAEEIEEAALKVLAEEEAGRAGLKS